MKEVGIPVKSLPSIRKISALIGYVSSIAEYELSMTLKITLNSMLISLFCDSYPVYMLQFHYILSLNVENSCLEHKTVPGMVYFEKLVSNIRVPPKATQMSAASSFVKSVGRTHL